MHLTQTHLQPLEHICTHAPKLCKQLLCPCVCACVRARGDQRILTGQNRLPRVRELDFPRRGRGRQTSGSLERALEPRPSGHDCDTTPAQLGSLLLFGSLLCSRQRASGARGQSGGAACSTTDAEDIDRWTLRGGADPEAITTVHVSRYPGGKKKKKEPPSVALRGRLHRVCVNARRGTTRPPPPHQHGKKTPCLSPTVKEDRSDSEIR